MKRLSLVQMQANQKGKVVEIHGGQGVINRLISMGIYKGKEITKLSQFALRGPVAIRVNRTILALGYGMASKIILEVE